MTDREIQANHSPASGLLNTHSEEKARRLHPSEESLHQFYEFVQEAGPHLASIFLDNLEELVQDLGVSPANSLHRRALLGLMIEFASGSRIVPWETSVELWGIEGNEPIQEKFIQLAFLRRYPKLFYDEQFNLDRRAELLGNPLDSVRNGLLAKVNSSPLKEVDLIEKGYSAAYLGYGDIIIPNLDILKKYATSWQSDTQFAPCTCLVGPTMIGKSRLLMKLAEEICVVYICLRTKDSTGEPKRSLLADDMLPSASTYYECCGKDSTGEPKQSLLAADMPPRPSPDYEYYYARLIAAILFVTVQFFQSAPNTDINTTYTEWFKHQTTAKFRSNVLQKSKSLPVKSSAELLGLAIDAIHNNALLKGPCLKVLLAVDEAGAMLVAPNKNEVSFFRLFRRALRKVPDHAGVLAILVDTTSRVSNFCPTNREDNSSRAIGARRAPPIKLFAPIYKINTFDQMVPSDPPKTWKELFLPDRLCRYGVPFFSIYLNDLKETHTVTNSNPIYAIPAMANFALKKLLCCEDVNGALKLTEVRALALLGPTIGVPLHGQSHLNVDLTASHAAHCGYLDPTRESQHSFYPSQPIYALAANDYLHKNEDALAFCIRSLASVLSQGHAGKGEAGELASRIILLCAMNKTADNIKIMERKGANQPNNPNQSVPATLPVDSTAFPSPVPVAQFLQTLTGFPVEELQLGTISCENREKLLGEGMMFWNHFQHCLSTPTPGSLMEGMERGLAMQCHDQQTSFDQLLPIYLKGPEDELDETHMTFCGVQVKSRIDDRDISHSQSIMTRTKAKITTNKNNPYLALHFSLRHKGPPKIKNSDINIRSPQDYTLPRSGTDSKQASLMFYGLESFHFLSPEVKKALEELINIRTDLISRHKREKDQLGENYAKAFLLRDERS